MNRLLLGAFAALIAALIIFNLHTGKAADAAKVTYAARHAGTTSSSHPTVVYQGDQRYNAPR